MATNDIVVQFASSLDELGEFKEYHVVSGSVFNQEYNETLDSATILLSHVKSEDRLLNIKPYDYVRVYDKSENTGLDLIYLLDNFNERIDNLEGPIYSYTINLMSETKLLEKIQCPNLVITHSLDRDGSVEKETIYEMIRRYMELYVPKIKFSSNENTWDYAPLIKMPTGDNYNKFYSMFNVSCADMSFTTPTLRQVLTSLMQQVGCIPVVRNRELFFLDLNAKPEELVYNNTFNYITRSLSSDSYVNTLVNISSGVLDSENEVICETLGFRDRSNVLLKQTENLSLETSFPIFKINKCILHGSGGYEGYLSSSGNCFEYSPQLAVDNPFPFFIYKSNTLNNIKLYLFDDPYHQNFDFTIQSEIIYLSVDINTNIYSEIIKVPFNFSVNSTSWVPELVEYSDEEASGPIRTLSTKSATIPLNNVPSNALAYVINGKFIMGNDEKPFAFIHFYEKDDNVQYHGPFSGDTQNYWHFLKNSAAVGQHAENLWVCRYILGNVAACNALDITKLVVENSVRETLERDFVKLIDEMSDAESWTIDNLSKYVYGTVGYSIGSNKISGFSEIFNIGSGTILGWIQQGKTYIECITLALSKNPETTYEYIRELSTTIFPPLKYIYLSQDDGSINPNFVDAYDKQYNLISSKFYYYDPVHDTFDETSPRYSPFFSTFFVDLYYQPLNSFNISYVKTEEDLDYCLEQYDGNASGNTDFDRLSVHEQEQVDRIGNETVSLSQRTKTFNDIKTLTSYPYVYGNHTIFKLSYTINNNFFEASYTGSKGAVLKNYFTSIRTKYRAYQYVDYSSSVVRKEKDIIYVKINKHRYDGDDKLWLGSAYLDNQNLNNVKYFVYDITNNALGKNQGIAYECEKDAAVVSNGIDYPVHEFEQVKNSVSVITTLNTIGIIYEHLDNVGAGPYLNNITTSISVEGQNYDIGGIPQAWQIWDTNSYNEHHYVMYVNDINYYSLTTDVSSSTPDTNRVRTELYKLQRSPIIDDSYIDLETSDNVIFSIRSKNDANKRKFYKDYAERINHTVQFIYYAPDKDVLFGEDFVAGAPLVNRFTHKFTKMYASTSEDDFKFNPYPHDPSSTEIANLGIVTSNPTNGSITITWGGTNIKVMKLCYEENGQVGDIAVFKRTGIETSSTYFFSFNDTKTDYVMAEKNGILYRAYKVKNHDTLGNTTRDVEDIYGV